jgi:6-pyruvoyl-tetrahydropterin synthase
VVFRAAVRASYDVAMFFPGDEGPSGRTHGHGYTVEAVLESGSVGESGIVADFEELQPLLAAVANELDHRVLNELAPFRGLVPSAERQAEYIFHRLSADVERQFGDGVRLVKVRVTQVPDAWVEYEP